MFRFGVCKINSTYNIYIVVISCTYSCYYCLFLQVHQIMIYDFLGKLWRHIFEDCHCAIALSIGIMVQQSGPKSPQKTYVRVLRPCEHGPSRDGPKGVNARVTRSARRAIVIQRHARHAPRRQWCRRRREVSW